MDWLTFLFDDFRIPEELINDNDQSVNRRKEAILCQAFRNTFLKNITRRLFKLKGKWGISEKKLFIGGQELQ